MKKLWRKLATLAAAVVAAFGAFSAPITAFAEESATETVATSVMEDLQTDATFSADNYPAKTIAELKAAGEEYLQVIKIGESVNGELYVYVYQPSDAEKEIKAAKILIGQTASESAARVYPLKLISTDGVFDKYLVDGLEVLASFDVRHYQITSLYRPFDTALDEEAANGGKDRYIAVPVAQTWYARNVDGGGIEYAHTYDEVITITDEWHGTIYYSDGFKLAEAPYTASHMVAFTTDKQIDVLKKAEVYFTKQKVKIDYCPKCLALEGSIVSLETGSPVPWYVSIEETNKGSNAADGWFGTGHKYEWQRIESLFDFIAAEGEALSDEAKQSLERIENSNENNTWILRYYETPYSVSQNGEWHTSLTGGLHSVPSLREERVDIADVAIMKLTFVTDGITYTMGVVDSMTTPDTIPDGVHGFWEGVELNFKEGFNDLERTLRLISLSIGAIVLMGAIALIVFWITRLVKWIRESKGSG